MFLYILFSPSLHISTFCLAFTISHLLASLPSQEPGQPDLIVGKYHEPGMPGFDGFPGGPPQPQGHGSPMRGGGMRGGGMRGGGGMGRGGGRGRGGRGGGGGGRGGGGGGIRFGSPQRGGGRGPMRGGGGGRGGGFDGFRENRYVWCGHATLVYGGSMY